MTSVFKITVSVPLAISKEKKTRLCEEACKSHWDIHRVRLLTWRARAVEAMNAIWCSCLARHGYYWVCGSDIDWVNLRGFECISNWPAALHSH